MSLAALSSALFATYNSALDVLIDGFKKGIVETEGTDEQLVLALYGTIDRDSNHTLTREKLLGLLLISAMRHARTQHDEQNTIGGWT